MQIINKSSPVSIWLFLVTFSLVFYGMGASFVESFVNYPTWKAVGPSEFRSYHQALSSLIVPFMVIPLIVTTILTALLLRFRPTAIPRWAIWVSLGLQIIIWISTLTIQLPIQFALSRDGLSIPEIERLITTNLWFRKIPGVINAALFFWLMSLLLRTHYTHDE
jgi:hypothetical protein